MYITTRHQSFIDIYLKHVYIVSYFFLLPGAYKALERLRVSIFFGSDAVSSLARFSSPLFTLPLTPLFSIDQKIADGSISSRRKHAVCKAFAIIHDVFFYKHINKQNQTNK